MKTFILFLFFSAALTISAQVTNSFPDNGNVGIGTASPTVNFEVYKYDGSSHARIYTNQHNGTATLEIAGGSASILWTYQIK